MNLARILPVIGALWLSAAGHAGFELARNGQPTTAIYTQPGATVPEKRAAQELAKTLGEITGAVFETREAVGKLPRRAILVGQGPAAAAIFPDIPFSSLGGEEIVIRTKGSRLLLAGGRPRGTLYAVSQFLERECGVRWWTPWASQIPHTPTLRVKDLSVRYQSPFESRDPFWFPAFNPEWAVRNCANGNTARIPDELGGSIRYKGFVHTFDSLVPPAEQFATHPEWYSLVKGQRTTKNAQLCLTNPKLLEFVIARVKQWLRESPECSILSVSQNDCHGACECPECKAVDDAEGSHAGTMLRFVNAVAEAIEPEFPHVAIDTLAYQYTRKPPKTVRPRPNLIVRLCSIECNFREPLDHPSNADFAADIRGWSAICQRLYIWDYTTDFGHYEQPHPNWFTLGPNVRFFRDHHVRGLFEQGAYQSYGSEMTELRSWVLAQLLWDPSRDDRALIREFLEGYYGKAAAAPIGRYLEIMYEASRGTKVSCFVGTSTPYHQFKPLAQAEELWRQAEAAVAADPALLARVRLGHLPVRYVWLARWPALRQECADMGANWPLPAARKEVADEWLKVANGVPGLDWTHVSVISESGVTPQQFVERLGPEPANDRPAVKPPGSATGPAPGKAAQKITVSPDRRGFVTADGKAFVPFGVSYFRPGTGWAPQVWRKFDEAATRSDFARLKELGGNCVRVFLSYGSFYSEQGVLNEEGLAKFDRFLALAEEAGLYVHPTGPDHWEGVPEWARGDRLAGETQLAAVETFWKLFAARYQGRSVIFAYDLLNEPEVGWDTPALREKWNVWLAEKYRTAEKIEAAWHVAGQSVQLGHLLPPTPRDAPGNPELLDYQRFREGVADEWTRRQVAAIKGADPAALVTVGLIQWSVPSLISGVQHYSAFRPDRQAPMLDFMEIHFYPLETGFYGYGGLQEETRNLAYLEGVVRQVAGFKKPVVVAEFGWYGGGKLTLDEGKHPPASEAQQARWCRRLIETTAGLACGWLNWGLYDHPEAGDVSQLIGLLTTEGKVKEWGRVFEGLAHRPAGSFLEAPRKRDRPALDWDMAMTSPRVGAQFRDSYVKAFEADLEVKRD